MKAGGKFLHLCWNLVESEHYEAMLHDTESQILRF